MAIRTVGIDLAIRGLHVATILDTTGDLIGSPIRFRHCPKDLEKLVRRVRDGLDPADQVIAVMEPTGMAWFPIAHWLARAGCTVIRVKGQRVRALRRYLSEHAKTDVIDAQVLGALPNFGGKGLTPLYLPNSQQNALNRLTKQRGRYLDETRSIRRRLKSLIRWANPGLEGALPALNTMVSLAVLERYLNPRSMRRLGQKRLIAFLDKNVGGKHPAHGPFTEQLAERLLDAARLAIKLYPAGEVDFDLLQIETRQEIQRLRSYLRLIDELNQEIERLYASLHPVDHLRTIPGVGTILAPSLLSVIHTSTRFGRQRRLRGYVGLFPRRSESGGQDNPSQRITKGGNNRLKRDLIVAAEIARKFDPELAAVYYSMMVNKGKHHNQALCAVATRLLSRIYAVLKEGRPYVIRDTEGGEVSLSEAKAIVDSRFKVPGAIRNLRRKRKEEVTIAA